MSYNEEILKAYANGLHGPISVLNYEEGPARAYLRYISTNSEMCIAEKTLDKGSQILLYRCIGSVSDYE